MKSIIVKKSDLLYILITLMIICSVFQNTLLIYSFPNVSYTINSIYNCLRVIVGILGIYHFIFTKKPMQQWLINMAYSIIFIVVFFNTRYYALFDMFFIPIFLNDYLDYKKIINIYLRTLIFMLIIVFIMHALNLFPNTIFSIYRNEKSMYRSSFGFGHPNGLGRHFLLIAILMFLKYENKIKVFHIVIMLFMGIWVYLYPQSVTSSTIIIFLSIYSIIIKIFKKSIDKSSIIKILKRIIIIVVPIFMIVSYAIFAKGVMIDKLSAISNTLGARSTLASSAINKYGFHLFGNKIQIVGKAQILFDSRFSTVDYSQVDNFFVYFSLTSGILALLFFIYFYTKSFRNVIKNRNTFLIIILLLTLLYSFMENSIVLFSSAFIYMLPMCNYNFTHLKEGTINNDKGDN